MYKIVQVLPALAWGGAQVFCIQLCNQLSKNPNYQVTLISLHHHVPGKHLPLAMLDNKVKFISLGKKKDIDFSTLLKMHQALKKIKPDVVHTHLHAGYYCLYAYHKLNFTYKKIHTLHNLAKQDAPLAGRIILKFYFRQHIIKAVTISEEVYKSAVKEYGPCIKTLIYNGAIAVKPTLAFDETSKKISSLKKNADTKVLLNVARISKQKNLKLLLDVMRMPDAQNVIAIVLGDYVAKNKNLYDELLNSKPSNVYFLGKVSNIGDYFLCADAFVLTSIFEGLPISLLEALSAGVVPVCTPVGGIKNIVTNDIGFLSKAVNKNAFYNALQSYLHADESTIQRLKNNGKELFNKKFSMQICASAYDALYHS